MTPITQTISAFPAPPDSASDTPQEFSTKADAFVDHQANTFGNEINTLKDQINTIGGEIDLKSTETEINSLQASSSANFKGEWNAGTSYTVPSSVYINGVYYNALQGSTNQNPETQPTYWVEAYSGTMVKKSGDTMTGNLEAPSMSIGGNNLDTFTNLHVASTSSTGALDSGKWTKIGRATITEIYILVSKTVTITSNDTYQDRLTTYKATLKVYQGASFGVDPTVGIELYDINDSNGLFLPKNIVAHIVQNTPTTIVDFYIKEEKAYTSLKIYEIANSGNILTWEWFSNQAFLTSVTQSVNGSWAGSNWVQPTMQNAWVNRAGKGYRKNSDGIVEINLRLSGGVNELSAFTLPAGFRPAFTRHFLISMGDVGTSNKTSLLAVYNTGLVVLDNYDGTNVDWTNISVQFLAEQ